MSGPADRRAGEGGRWGHITFSRSGGQFCKLWKSFRGAKKEIVPTAIGLWMAARSVMSTGALVLDFGLLAGEALPLTGGCADPGVGPALGEVDVAVAHLTFAGPEAGGDGDVVVDEDFDVGDFVALPVAGLEVGEEVGLGSELAIGADGDEVVGEHGGDDVGFAGGLRIGPTVLELGNGGRNIRGRLSECGECGDG